MYYIYERFRIIFAILNYDINEYIFYLTDTSKQSLERRFLASDTLQTVLDYLTIEGFHHEEYKVLSSWPRRDVSILSTVMFWRRTHIPLNCTVLLSYFLRMRTLIWLHLNFEARPYMPLGGVNRINTCPHNNIELGGGGRMGCSDKKKSSKTVKIKEKPVYKIITPVIPSPAMVGYDQGHITKIIIVIFFSS